MGGHKGKQSRFFEAFSSRQRYSWILAVIIALILWWILDMTGVINGVPMSTIERHRMDTNMVYNANNVIDEDNWFSNVAKVEDGLQAFFDLTGVQPMVLIHHYDPGLESDEEKQQWAHAWYQSNLQDENTFLYVYFRDSAPGAAGYKYGVSGRRAAEVMDTQAIHIFNAYLQRNYFSNQSPEDSIINTFSDTARDIMNKPVSIGELVTILVIVVVVLTLAIVLIVFGARSRLTKKRDKEMERESQNANVNSLDRQSSNDWPDQYD